MAIASDLTSREMTKFRESTDVSGQVGIVVVNPDGSSIGSSGGGGSSGVKAEDSAHASGDNGVVMLAKRTDTAAVSSGTDGDYSTVNVDSLGAMWMREVFAPGYENNTDGVANTYRKFPTTSTNAVSVDQSAALEASSVAKASAGRFLGLLGRIDSTAGSGTYYIQVLNASSLPADGAVTHLKAPKKIQHTTGTDSDFEIDVNDVGGIYASTGIVWCISTTEFTKTIGSAVVSADCYYV